MRIINSFNAILNAFPDKVFNMQVWRNYISTINPKLILKCEDDAKGYDFQKDILPVVNCALNNQEKMNCLNDAFQAITKDLPNKISKLFNKDTEIEIILYLGLCNGAGWATTLDDKDVILFGIEKIIELDWYNKDDMQALIFHEIGHIWHKVYGKLDFKSNSQKEKSLLQLYQEGVAMVCEQILCGDDNYYHQDRNGWLLWCIQNEKIIKNEYLIRLNNSESTQGFFGDWCNYKGHSDVGYFLGCKFVKYLQEKYSMIEIANLSYNILLDEFADFAK